MSLGTVVVTGASSGIGAATAQALASRGYRTVLISRSTEITRQMVDAMPISTLGSHVPIACDVTSPGSIAAAADVIRDNVGSPDGLVNAAGVCLPQRLEEFTIDNWQQTIDTNLTGTFLVSRVIAALMADGDVEGSIVNVGSELGLFGMPGYVSYCASKAGLLGLTKAMAAELAPNIRVNVLCPGPVDTPMLRAELALEADPDAAWQRELRRIPLGKIAQPQQIAEAICWLLDSPLATGSVLSVDGGTSGTTHGAAERLNPR